jgi:formylglycine-generating enzyme required for sulfatase activity
VPGVAPQTTDQTEVEALQRQIAELQAQLAAAQVANAPGEHGVRLEGDNTGPINTGKMVATQGGAFVEGAVEVRNGHFIGRDYVKYVTQIIQVGEDPEEAKAVIARYLHALAADLAGLKLGEIDKSIDQVRREPLQLADIYVPLDTTHRIPQGQTLEEWLSQGPDRKTAKPFDLEALRPVAAIEALAAHRELTLLGKPGSGKSTFGASVLLALAQAWQGQTAQLASLGKRWTQGPLLPIRVVLRRFAEQLPTGNQPARAGDLWCFISQELDASGYGLSGKAMDYVQRIARTRGALILLDGLDECGDEVRRGRVLDAVKELMGSAGPQCRFLLTARPYAWPGGPDPEQGVYALAELNDDQIEQFIRAWYAALVRRKWRQPGEIGSKIDDLLQARQRRDLLPLARNPLLLTLMATLHTNRGRLQDDRFDLYNDSVDLLLVRWNQQVGADKALLDALNVPGLKLSSLREVLEGLAFKVHGENVGQEGTADIGEDLLVRAFRPLLQGSRDKAAMVVDYIDTRAGLLIGQGPKDGERQFTFPHRTFQEFLAACHLAAQVDLSARGVELARQHAGHWKEVLVLAARQAKSDRGAALADALIGGEPFDPARDAAAANTDLACAVVAAEQLIEIGVANLAGVHHRDAVRKRVASWLAGGLQAFDRAPRPRDRAYMGDLLSTLGDPRFDPRRFYLPADDLLGFVHIPADPQFRIGTREADEERVTQIIGSDAPDEERNNSRTPTPEFYIARYPVTVAQFRAFIAVMGCGHGDDRALRDPDNRPVRYISWYEARAYTEWLNDALASTSVLAGSSAASLVREGPWRVALPSELEWEKAARGGFLGAVYSWGDTHDPDRANCSEAWIRDTSPVGCFPSNTFGLYDMIGNVWEWTRSRYDSYPYRPVDGRENPEPAHNDWLVVRGGSWEDALVYARCSSRPGLLPDGARRHVGFRVVLRPPPVS